MEIINLIFLFIIAGLRQRTVGPPAVKGRLSFGHQEMSSTPLVPSNMNRMATTGQTPGFPMRAISGNKKFVYKPNVKIEVSHSSSIIVVLIIIILKEISIHEIMLKKRTKIGGQIVFLMY